MTLVAYALLALVATAVIWKGSDLLERSSGHLADYYELPEVVKGALLVAVGSSFPELATTVISTLVHGSFELGVAAIVGSAIFNILVIPGLSGLLYVVFTVWIGCECFDVVDLIPGLPPQVAPPGS